MEWNDGMERWNGMEWNGTVVGSAHAPIASSFSSASCSGAFPLIRLELIGVPSHKTGGKFIALPHQ